MNLVAKRPDTDARRLIRVLSVVPPPRHTGPDTVAALRRDWQLSIKAFASRPKVAQVRQLSIPGPAGEIQMRAYLPKRDPQGLPILVWYHGGGFVFGDLYTAGATARALTSRSGVIVVTVKYRLAPEHRLEDGRADAMAAVRWVAEHASELGADPTKIGVGGDSAGGGVAAMVAQQCRDEGIKLKLQLLVYPATDMNSHNTSDTRSIGLLTPERVDWILAQLRRVNDLADPSQSALKTRDLTGLAPTILVTCGYDPLREEGLAYGRRLTEADVVVHGLHYPGMIHGFVALDRVLASGGHALDRIAEALRKGFVSNLEGVFRSDLPGARIRVPMFDPLQRMREAQVSALVARERFGQLRTALTGTPITHERGEMDFADA